MLPMQGTKAIAAPVKFLMEKKHMSKFLALGGKFGLNLVQLLQSNLHSSTVRNRGDAKEGMHLCWLGSMQSFPGG